MCELGCKGRSWVQGEGLGFAWLLSLRYLGQRREGLGLDNSSEQRCILLGVTWLITT